MFFKNNNCLNCGKIGHEQRNCRDPITSWGIILVHSMFNDNIRHKYIDIKKYEKFDGIKIYKKEEMNFISDVLENIKFLLVRRKHSLGYCEFIRGKYVAKNINGIMALFNQMTPNEIKNIKNSSCDFANLWKTFWNLDDNIIFTNKKEYIDSKSKFESLKDKIDVEFDLDFYLSNANPSYDNPEWGFPKGKKMKGENDLTCALREFYEETGITEDKINIINSMKPIVEELIGTNGVSYRHIYFLAELKNNTQIYDNENNKIINNDELIEKNSEIGGMEFFSYNSALNTIRDYHYGKLNIVKCLTNYYFEIYKSNNTKSNYDEEWIVMDQ